MTAPWVTSQMLSQHSHYVRCASAFVLSNDYAKLIRKQRLESAPRIAKERQQNHQYRFYFYTA